MHGNVFNSHDLWTMTILHIFHNPLNLSKPLIEQTHIKAGIYGSGMCSYVIPGCNFDRLHHSLYHIIITERTSQPPTKSPT